MTHSAVTVPSLDALLDASAATDRFKEAARELAARKAASERIAFGSGAPPVKVQRVLQQLLESEPSLAIDAIAVSGQSGCSDFRGELTVHLADGSSRRFRFVWDCAWKARQVGWNTFWGDPDQQKAAQTFGYRCFEVFEPIPS
ncbi:MAG: hypothetical protein KF858_16345 [Candidatus Sumerlaeia bacterium]|nr:hypothetical protein [Candidatus Sumerlaeia bacterium]